MTADLIRVLESVLGDRLRRDSESLASHSRDRWVLSELEDLQGRPGPLPCAVVEPVSTDEVARVLVACREARVPVVPYGAGSGVCGGIAVPGGAVVLSLARLTGVVEINEVNCTATFRAGTNGMQAEQAVREHGLTIGHWPQSIEISSVGGWVATRASGQFSTAYGNIEDMLLDLEAVLPNGSVLRTRRTPRASAGPDLRQILMGSEGTLGVITEVTFSLRPLPAASRGQAIHFADFHSGLEAIRRLMHAGWRPPVVRLYDSRESERHFSDACPAERAMLILLHEGPKALVEVQIPEVAQLCADVGGEVTDPGVVDHWLETRNEVPAIRGLLEKGLVVDTIEVAATWDRIEELYQRATESLAEVPNLLIGSAHSSHSYRSGTNLYITFVAKPADANQMASTYRECWRRVMQAALDVGGGVSHHHGIGRVRRDYLAGEIGASGVGLLRSLKRSLDPDNLLNPGTLLPPDLQATAMR